MEHDNAPVQAFVVRKPRGNPIPPTRCRVLQVLGLIMAGERAFTCLNCKELNQVVKVEAGPETDNHEIAACAVARLQGGRGSSS
jgi:hypothetical protein